MSASTEPPRTAAPSPAFSLRRVLRDTPHVVWVLAVAQLLLGTFYALAVPLLHGPDEHSHIDLINALDADSGYPEHGTLTLSYGTLAALDEVGLDPAGWRVAYQRPWGGLSADELLPRDGRPSWSRLGGPGRSNVRNHVTSHPPLYYVSGAAVTLVTADLVSPAGDAWPWDRQASFLRLLNTLLLAPLPVLAFAAAARLTGSRRTALVAAVVPLAIPQLAHLAGTVNNDNLLTLLAGALTVVTAFIATGDLTRRTAVWAGALAGAAILAKGFGLAAPGWIVLAYGIAAVRVPGRVGAPAHRRQVALGVGVAALTTLVAGGWWELRLLVREGRLLKVVGQDPTLVGFDPETGWWAWFFVRRLTHKFWGFFGIEQASLPIALIVIAALAATVAVSWSLRPRSWREAPGSGANVLVALAPIGTTLVLVTIGAWQGYARTGLTTGVQGRYLFVGVVGLAVAVAVGLVALLRARWLPVAVLGFAGVMQAAGTLAVVNEYWAGANLVARIRTLLAFSPWPPELVVLGWLVLAVSGGAAAWLLWPEERPA